MSQPVQPELFCPKCRIEVQPIKAAVHWYCPHCAWQFSDEDVWRQLNGPKKAQPPGGNRLPDDRSDDTPQVEQ